VTACNNPYEIRKKKFSEQRGGTFLNNHPRLENEGKARRDPPPRVSSFESIAFKRSRCSSVLSKTIDIGSFDQRGICRVIRDSRGRRKGPFGRRSEPLREKPKAAGEERRETTPINSPRGRESHGDSDTLEGRRCDDRRVRRCNYAKDATWSRGAIAPRS